MGNIEVRERFLRLVLIIILVCFANDSFSTEQIPDVLNFEMRNFEIEEAPLEELLTSTDFRELYSENDVIEMCSANWRGYKAYWHIMNEALYLSHVQTKVCSNPKAIDLSKIISKNNGSKEAVWYTGNLTVRISGISRGRDENGNSTGLQFEAIVFNIKRGKLLSREVKTVVRKW